MNRLGTTFLRSFLLLCIAAATLHAADAASEHLFAEGNAFYEKQAYDSALSRYAAVEARGIENADLFFNQGDAFFRSGHAGQAIRFWEKALALRPGDADTKANLAFVRARIADRIPEPESDFIGFILLKIHGFMPLAVQLRTSAAILLILSCLFAWALFASPRKRMMLSYIAALVALPLLYTVPSAAAKINDSLNAPRAVVIEAVAAVLNEPQGRTTLLTVHEGTTFTIRKTQGDWCLVSLPNGASGWVEEKFLGRI